MLTQFGIMLRKMRIERQELLKDMAGKLDVSSAYLSAVETGKRRIPQNWVTIISEKYALDQKSKDALQQAADNSASEITIPLDGASSIRREAVLSFARALDGLSDEELTKIMTAMKKKGRKRSEK